LTILSLFSHFHAFGSFLLKNQKKLIYIQNAQIFNAHQTKHKPKQNYYKTKTTKKNADQKNAAFQKRFVKIFQNLFL